MTEPSKTPRTDSDPLSDDDLDRLEHDWTKDVTWHNAEARLMATVRKLQRSLSDATSDLDNARENWNGFIDPINTFCTGEPDFVIRHEGGPREAAQNVIDFIKARGDYAEKLAALVDRALTMMMAAGYKVSPHDPDHNNPLVAWMADARAALRTENKAVPTRAKPPCPGCESLCLECPQHDEAAQSVPAIFHDLRVRIWNRIAPDTISIRFQRPITDAEAERFSRAFVALLTPEPGAARALVNEQAEDEGLWFEAVHASEAHLQRALRDLHAAVERECPSLFSGRWIPVGERMPPQVWPTVWSFPDDRQILARNSGGYMACVTALYRAMGGVICGDDATSEETEYRIGDVTHWMELPADPDRNCDSQVPVRCDGRDINKCPNPTQCEIEGKCLAEVNVKGNTNG